MLSKPIATRHRLSHSRSNNPIIIDIFAVCYKQSAAAEYPCAAARTGALARRMAGIQLH